MKKQSPKIDQVKENSEESSELSSDISFEDDPDEEDSDLASKSNEDALLKAFMERKRKELAMGNVIGNGQSLTQNLKKGKLKSKDAL